MVWDPNGDADFWKNPEDREKQAPKLDSKNTEERYRKIATEYMRMASGIGEGDFLVLRMKHLGLSDEEIARRLGIKMQAVVEVWEYIEWFIYTHGRAQSEVRVKAVIAGLCQFGHTEPCWHCDEPVHVDHRFCAECGEKNPEFDHKTFVLLHGHQLTRERLVNCRVKHGQEIASEKYGYCIHCGIDLEPLQRADS